MSVLDLLVVIKLSLKFLILKFERMCFVLLFFKIRILNLLFFFGIVMEILLLLVIE